MVELMKAGFYPFVLTLSENVVKKVVWDIYFTIKADSGRIPAMKLSGAAGFATVCLMKEFGCIRENENLVKQCNYIFYQIFQYTPDDVMEKTIRMAMETQDFLMTYQDFARAQDYLKKNYGKWLSELEFASGKSEDAMLRYEKFRMETVPELNGWDAVQASADQIGLSVRIAKPDMTVHPAVENFFDRQEKEVREEYESGQTDSLYRKIKSIPCKTVYVDGLVREMEEKIGMTQKDNQEALLQKFLEEIKDCKTISGRGVFGDNEAKIKQAENSFVSSGKFEHILLFNDTSVLKNGKEGMAVTTEKIYYKNLVTGGELDLKEVAGFEFSGAAFSQKLMVRMEKGKKYYLPCRIEKEDYYTYLKILEILLKIIRQDIFGLEKK